MDGNRQEDKIINNDIFAAMGILFCFGAVAWVGYGFFCALNCGYQESICTVEKLKIEIKVCQGRDPNNPRYYPYTGVAVWCFEATVGHPPQNKTLCFDEQESCTDDLGTAYRILNASAPVGTSKSCWYAISAYSFTTGQILFYFEWSAPLNFSKWLTINIIYTSIALVFVVILLLAVVIKLFCRHRNRQSQIEMARTEDCVTDEESRLLLAVN